MTILDSAAIADVAYSAGFRGEALKNAVAIALAESGGNSGALGDINLTTGGEVSVGLWQINWRPAYAADPARNREANTDPATAARNAYTISQGGTNFRPWSTYTDGKYRSFLGQASGAASNVNARGGALTPAASPTATAGGINLGTAGAPRYGGGGEVATDTSADVGLPPPGQLLASAYVAPLSTKYIVLEGFGAGKDYTELDLSARVIGGEMSMSVEQVSQLSLTLIDTDRRLGRKGLLRSEAPLTWSRPGLVPAKGERQVLPWNGQVAAHEIDGEDPLTWKITSRSITSQLLRHGDMLAAGSIKNASLSEYGAQLAKAVGADFTGQGLPRQGDIAPDVSADKPESAWDVLQRVAADEGVWAWEADGHLYVGKPSWLIDRLVTVPVTVETGRITDCIGLPRPRESIDAPGGAVTLDLNLPRWRGELVRPGMTLAMTWPDWLSNYPDRFLVSSVSWPVDGGLAPVALSCVEPVDPPVKQAIDSSAAADAGPSGPTGTIGPPDPNVPGGGLAPSMSARPSAASSAGLIWPVSGSVSSPFGPRGGRNHDGIDIPIPLRTPVKASTSGKVVLVKTDSAGYGLYLDIARDDGLITRYAHLSSAAVNVGDRVAQGQVVAYSGDGGNATAPIVHFETRPGGAPVNPIPYLPK